MVSYEKNTHILCRPLNVLNAYIFTILTCSSITLTYFVVENKMTLESFIGQPILPSQAFLVRFAM